MSAFPETTPDADLCGARRYGWQRPGPGRHRLPCLLPGGHDGGHQDAFMATWPPTCEDCGTTTGRLEGNTTVEADGTVRDGHLCGPCATVAVPGPAPEPEPARRPVRMCVRCCTITDRPVVVSEVHVNTGPGFNVYACPDCAPLFPPVPDVLTLLPAGRRAGVGGERAGAR
ncbi:hypothetical protein [Streptomyces sp. NPDC002845]